MSFINTVDFFYSLFVLSCPSAEIFHQCHIVHYMRSYRIRHYAEYRQDYNMI